MSYSSPKHRDVFFAHRGGGDDSTQAAVTFLTGKITEKVAPCLVTAGRDDHKARFRECGSWGEWQSSVARRYDLFIVPPGPMGKATAVIVREALLQGKDVMAWNGLLGDASSFKRATSVITNDEKNWKAGWSLACEK